MPRRLLSSCLLGMSACADKAADDSGATTAADSWAVVGEDLSSALMSIAGSDTNDLWLVGGDTGSGPLVVHHDGSAWTQVETSNTGDLWWVWMDPAGGVWTVGGKGRVVRIDSAGTASEEVLDEAVTLFGIWGTSSSDLWTVGGDVSVSHSGARMWHYDGSAWTAVELPTEVQERVAVYKVWGTSSSDVWAVGTSGLAMHWDGASWTVTDTGIESNLFTVHGAEGDVFAVGGEFSGAVIRWDGNAWVSETTVEMPQFNGVYAREGCPTVAVGTIGGAVWWRTDGVWAPDPRPSPTYQDFHAGWLSPGCDALASGGSISSFPLDKGIVAWGGAPAEIASLSGF